MVRNTIKEIFSFKKPVAIEMQPMPNVAIIKVYSADRRVMSNVESNGTEEPTRVGHIAEPSAKKRERRKGKLKRTNDPGGFPRIHLQIFLDLGKRRK